jgi:hypothetical protein
MVRYCGVARYCCVYCKTYPRLRGLSPAVAEGGLEPPTCWLCGCYQNFLGGSNARSRRLLSFLRSQEGPEHLHYRSNIASSRQSVLVRQPLAIDVRASNDTKAYRRCEPIEKFWVLL